MLTNLSIKGLAIIDSLDIEFGGGLNVITGETGAGKSILIKALNLLMGGKANAEHVRRGANQALVSGVFELQREHPALKTLAELGIDIEGQGQKKMLLLRRQVASSGRSLCWINDAPVGVNTLQKVSTHFVDIFGQHENQKLLDPTQHIHYLDQFSAQPSVLTKYRETYNKLKNQLLQLRELLSFSKSVSRDKDYWNFRLVELEDFGPSLEDYQKLLEITRSAKNQQAQQDLLNKAQEIVDRGCDGESLSKGLWRVHRYLQKFNDHPDLRECAEFSTQIAQSLDELSFKLSKFAEGSGYSERELDDAQNRIATYQELCRKLGVHDVENLISALEELKGKLEQAEQCARQIKQCIESMHLEIVAISSARDSLHLDRQNSFKKLKQRVELELADLAMKDSKIELHFEAIAPKDLGIDSQDIPVDSRSQWTSIQSTMATLNSQGSMRYQFLMSTNKGEELLPLAKIASGGEVSRLMLALKRGVAAEAETCVLIFDEIDTGISGKIADMVGAKLYDLALKFQVICISHLPQVASYADEHFLVEKYSASEGRTESSLRRLNEKESVYELARLLSGKELTASSIAHAKLLKDRSARPGTNIPASTPAAKATNKKARLGGPLQKSSAV